MQSAYKHQASNNMSRQSDNKLSEMNQGNPKLADCFSDQLQDISSKTIILPFYGPLRMLAKFLSLLNGVTAYYLHSHISTNSTSYRSHVSGSIGGLALLPGPKDGGIVSLLFSPTCIPSMPMFNPFNTFS